jgi:TM2 domain-containing membrane protein YozV
VSETVLEQASVPRRATAAALLPCVLTWLVPGLGHLYLGKRRRAAVFCAVVLATFGLGLASDGAAALIDPRQPLTYLATFDNLALGPLDLVARWRTYGRLAYRLPAEENHPVRVALTSRLRERVRSVTYEYGNTFLLTAGLMNLLLMLDVFDIASGRKP